MSDITKAVNGAVDSAEGTVGAAGAAVSGLTAKLGNLTRKVIKEPPHVIVEPPVPVGPETGVDEPTLVETVLALIRHPQLGTAQLQNGASAPDARAVLLLRPPGSLSSIESGVLGNAAASVGSFVAGLRTATASPVAGWMFGLSQISELVAATNTYTVVRDLEPEAPGTWKWDDLSTVHFDGMPGGAVFSSPNAEDFFHSLVLVAPPGSTLTCFNDRGCGDGQGAFRITVAESGVVIIRDLGSPEPATEPPRCLEVLHGPEGGYEVFSSMSWPGGGHKISGFGGEMSSLTLSIPGVN
jgi:hypothetical protein